MGHPTKAESLEYVEKIYDNEGNAKTRTERRQIIHYAEPDYVKLYLDDIGVLFNIPESSNPVLFELLKGMDYEGIIETSIYKKQKISKVTSLSVRHVQNAIQKFCKEGLLLRVRRGTYQANPHLFAKGKWKDIRARRQAINFNISYIPDNRGGTIKKVRTSVRDLSEQQEIDFGNGKINRGKNEY